jgi:hypothetical protein
MGKKLGVILPEAEVMATESDSISLPKTGQLPVSESGFDCRRTLRISESGADARGHFPDEAEFDSRFVGRQIDLSLPLR